VILRKPTTDGDFIRRRYCLDCGHRWYTLQTAETLIEGHKLQWSKLTRTYTIHD
jgi:transcriptional regulator NrdR family protein